MEKKSIKKNMLMSVILTSSNFIFPLITYSYVARILTPVGTGKVAFVSSIIGYFTYISTLGVPSYGLRECAKIRDNRNKLSTLVQELLLISLVATIVCYIILFFSVITIPKLFEYKRLFLIMSCHIFLNSIGVEWFYQSIEEYSYITVRSIAFKIIAVVLTFVLIHQLEDYIWYGFITIFTTSASYIFNFFHLRKFITLKKREKYNLRRHLLPILILFASSIVLTVYNNFDVTMLGLISGEREVGLYNSALKVKNIVLSLSSALTAVMIPRIAYFFEKNDKENVYGLLRKSLNISLLVAIPVAIYILIYTKDVLLFVAGKEYIDAVGSLRVLIICIIPLVITNLCGNQILIPSGNEKRYTQSVTVGLVIDIVLNILLIPTNGAVGAALGTLAAELWNVFWMGVGAANYLFEVLKKTNFIKYGICFLFAIIISYFSDIVTCFDNVVLRLIFSSVLYFGCYYFGLAALKEPMVIDVIDNLKRRIIG